MARTDMELQLIKQYDQFDARSAWSKLYEKIDELSEKQERSLKLTAKIALAWENLEKNRYRNVFAYDSSRIKLKRISGVGSDYINASPLVVPRAKRNYILTQGPLSTTSNDFWHMVWEQKCPIIVMLNRILEKGSPKECPTRRFDSFDVSLKEEENFEHFIVRDVQLTCNIVGGSQEDRGQSSYVVKHFQFTSWPDFGVPHSTSVFIDFLKRVRATGLLGEQFPAVIHCSAGIGRTGTFVVADSILSMVENNVNEINVIDLVIEMRKSRRGLIQTPMQLQFCWKTVADALREKHAANDPTPSSNGNKLINNDISKESGDKSFEIMNNIKSSLELSPPDEPRPGPLLRSQANQMTSGQLAKSCGDIAGVRKRSSTEVTETEKDAKQAKRMERIEQMRMRLRKAEEARKKWHGLPVGQSGLGYACAAALVAVAVYCVYRIIS